MAGRGRGWMWAWLDVGVACVKRVVIDARLRAYRTSRVDIDLLLDIDLFFRLYSFVAYTDININIECQ